MSDAYTRILRALQRVNDPRPMLYDPDEGPSPQERLDERVEEIWANDLKLALAIISHCSDRLAREIVRLVHAVVEGEDPIEWEQGIVDELGPVVEARAAWEITEYDRKIGYQLRGTRPPCDGEL